MIDRAGSTGLSVFLMVMGVTSFRESRDVQDLELPRLVGLGDERAVVEDAVDAEALEPGPAEQGATRSRGK